MSESGTMLMNGSFVTYSDHGTTSDSVCLVLSSFIVLIVV